ncbi:ABC-type transport auxiliary lipoprotein family protein [Novosphingobium endophyticum]|nr:ABC-type transport auxiliary lipoprotein family protein [Novosphingobium endophyticum]
MRVRAAGAARGAVIASVSLALAGCISLGAKVPEQLLRLTPEAGAEVGSQATGQLSEAIVVLDPEADRSLDVLRVPVQVNDSSIAYLKDVSWVEKPARQFRGVLAEAIRTATGRLVVEGTEYEVTGKTLVGGRLQRMGYDAATGAVVVRFDAMRRERGGEIATRRFEAVVNNVKPEAAWVGPALNQAANDVARQVADWIKGE